MNLKKYTAIGIIALFLGMIAVPAFGTTIEKQETEIELSMLAVDGSIESETITLSNEELKELSNLIGNLNKDCDGEGLLHKIMDFLKRCDGKGCKRSGLIRLLRKHQGTPVLSIGEDMDLFNKHDHGKIRMKKLINTWYYPTEEFSMTMIWKDGIMKKPTQTLKNRQIGFMIGFVGFHIEFPSIIPGLTDTSCTFGKARLAWGMEL